MTPWWPRERLCSPRSASWAWRGSCRSAPAADIGAETDAKWLKSKNPAFYAGMRPHSIWHLHEVYLKIDGRMVYLWRAVDAEGEVLDVLVQSRRNKHAALKLMRKLLRKYAVVPYRLVTDDLRSYRAATLDLGIDHLHDRGRVWNNIGPRTHISRPDGGSARCNASRARA